MKIDSKTVAKYAFVIAFVAVFVGSWRCDFAKGIAAGRHFRDFLMEMVAFLPLLFVLVGLMDVWLSRSVIERHIGNGSGIKGALWMIMLAMFQAGPLYGAFPVAQLLWKKGCSTRNIFIYLGAFSTLKLPMLMFEIGFLGLKFSLLRTLMTLPVFVLIAVIMDAVLKPKGLIMFNPADEADKSVERNAR